MMILLGFVNHNYIVTFIKKNMTLHDFGKMLLKKRLNMTAILKFKRSTEDAFEKKWNQLRFCSQGYLEAKKHRFHYRVSQKNPKIS